MNNNNMSQEEKFGYDALQTAKLIEAIKNNNFDRIQKALKNGADVKGNINAIFGAVEQHNNREVINALMPYTLSNNSNENINNGEIFQKAVVMGDLEMIKYLLDNNTSIHVRNDCGIRTSASKGNLDLIKFFVKNGASISANHDEPIKNAVLNGHINIIEYILKECRQNMRVHDVALESAITSENLTSLDYLLKKRVELGYELPAIPDNASKSLKDLIQARHMSIELESELKPSIDEVKVKKVKI